jgi:hypothetical protein
VRFEKFEQSSRKMAILSMLGEKRSHKISSYRLAIVGENAWVQNNNFWKLEKFPFGVNCYPR